MPALLSQNVIEAMPIGERHALRDRINARYDAIPYGSEDAALISWTCWANVMLSRL